jgi:ABC-type sugar transport system substrate-binding protein
MKTIFSLLVAAALLVSVSLAQKGKMRHGTERIVVKNKGNDGMFKTTMGQGAPPGAQ